MAVYRDAGDEILFMKCPFNPNHRVAERRYQFHVQSCPDKERANLVKCQHNASHYFPRGGDAEHYQTCRDFAASLRHNIESREVDAERKRKQQQELQQQSASGSSGRRDMGGWKRGPGGRSVPQEQRRYEWDEELERQGEFAKPLPKLITELANEPDWWKKHCFAEDGTLTRQLCTIGLSRLTASERQEYYKMLNIAAKKLAEIRAAAPPVPVVQEEEPVDTIDWAAGASVRSGLLAFASRSNAQK